MHKISVSFFQLMFIGVLAGFADASPTPVATQKSDFHMMFESNWPNPDPNINRFPHQTSCHYYYLVLSEEDISIRKCHDDKLFDYVVHKCVKKESANCWSRHFAAINHNHHLLHKKPKKFKCPYAYGKFPDVTDCTRYFQCLAGKAKRKKCAPFEYFDKIERKCIAEIQAVCADETDVVEHGYKCPRTWGSFSFSKDCSKYYECIEKRPDLMTCPRHTLFDEKKRKCVSHKRAHCGSRYNPYEEKTTLILPSPRSQYEIIELPKVTSQESSPRPSSSNKPPPTAFDKIVGDITIKSYVSPMESSEEPFDNSKESKDSTEDPFQDNSKESKDSTEDPLQDNSKESEESSEDPLKDHSNGSSEKPHEDNSKEFVENPQTDNSKDLKDEDVFKKSAKDSKLSSVSSNEIISTIEIKPSNKILIDQEIKTTSDGKSSTEAYPSTKYDKVCLPDDHTCILLKDRIFRCPVTNGLFPHPEDERHFFHCVNFKIYVKTCPYQLIFNDFSKACAWPLNLAQKNA